MKTNASKASTPWTTDRLIHMSESLALAHGGTDRQQAQQHCRSGWTAKRLVDLSSAMRGLL